jgi:polysaccharide pyruvyl transferase WcaK-like protein
MATGGRAARIAFWGNFGTANWGNECTLQAIVQNVRARAPAVELACVCSIPDDTARRHGVIAWPISERRLAITRAAGAVPQRSRIVRLLARVRDEVRDWVITVQRARTVDAIVMSGTGMLTDDGEGALGLPYEMFRWAAAAKLWGRRVAFVSVGVEPIQQRATRFFIGAALRLADFRSYRDQRSKDNLRRIGLGADADPVYPDLAFSLPPAGAVGSPASPPRVAVGLYEYMGRGTDGPEAERGYRAYLDRIGAFVLELLGRGHDVRIVLGDLRYDLAVLEDLRRWFNGRDLASLRGRLFDDPANSVDDVLRQLAAVDLVVASRFHNVLLALLLGKPVVSVSYEPKNDVLMAAMGLADYCQSLDDFDPARLRQQFSALAADAEGLRPMIGESAAQCRTQLDQQYRDLLATIGIAAAVHADTATAAARAPLVR